MMAIVAFGPSRSMAVTFSPCSGAGGSTRQWPKSPSDRESETSVAELQYKRELVGFRSTLALFKRDVLSWAALRMLPSISSFTSSSAYLNQKPFEDGVRARVRGFIEAMLEEELAGALSRPRYGRLKPGEDEAAAPVVGVRHGHRERTLTGTFGKTRIAVPRARLTGEDGTTSEWKSASLRAYQRRTKAADALIAGAYLSGTNTRRVRRALAAVFAGPVGKDVVSRAWRKVKGDWDAWSVRSLDDEPIVRLILDGTVVRVRLDRRATSISLLVALGVRSSAARCTSTATCSLTRPSGCMRKSPTTIAT